MVLAISGHDLPLHFRQRRPESPPNVLILLDPGLRTSGDTVEDELDSPANQEQFTAVLGRTVPLRASTHGLATSYSTAGSRPRGPATRGSGSLGSVVLYYRQGVDTLDGHCAVRDSRSVAVEPLDMGEGLVTKTYMTMVWICYPSMQEKNYSVRGGGGPTGFGRGSPIRGWRRSFRPWRKAVPDRTHRRDNAH